MKNNPLLDLKINDIVFIHIVESNTTRECFLKVKILETIVYLTPTRPMFFGLVLQTSNQDVYPQEYSYWFFPLSQRFTVIKIKEQ